MLPPRLSDRSRRKAGRSAVRARQERSEVKAKVASGQIYLFDLFGDERDSIKRMKLADLLQAVPGIGSKRAELIMDRSEISKSRRLGGVGRRQIEALRQEFLLMKNAPREGKLLVVSGPSGVGKSTITNKLRGDERFWISVSATTREPRPGEVDGEAYHFVTPSEFQKMIDARYFLEWADFAGARYGTPRQPVLDALTSGKDVLLEIEIEGARQVKQSMPEAMMVFL